MYLALFYLVLPCLAAIWARGMHARRRDGADGRSVFFPLLVISEQWNIRVFWVLGTFWMQFLEGFWKIPGWFLNPKFLKNLNLCVMHLNLLVLPLRGDVFICLTAWPWAERVSTCPPLHDVVLIRPQHLCSCVARGAVRQWPAGWPVGQARGANSWVEPLLGPPYRVGRRWTLGWPLGRRSWSEDRGDCGFEMALGAEQLRPAFMVRRRGALEMPEGAPVALYRGSVGPVWTTQGLRGP
jgi:hypothetical protein